MADKGQDPVRNKFETDYKIRDKVNSINYLGNSTSYEK
jgi:hypothetical protein